MATPAQRPVRVAERLKEARESRGVSQRQIADVTKLSVHVIRGFEEGRASFLPPGVYRRSLVRAFAKEVGLDPESTLRAYLEEAPDGLPAPGFAAGVIEAPPPAPRGSWRRLLTTIGAAIPLLAGVAYFGTTTTQRTGELSPAIPLARGDNSWHPEIVPAGGFSEPPPPAVLPVAMLVTVSARCDLEVMVDGGLMIGRTIEAGESFQVAFKEAVEFSGSNAGAVQYSINGQAGRMLGAPGEPLSARIGRDDYPFYLTGR